MTRFIDHLRWGCWALCGSLMLLLVAQPVSVQAQAALGVVVVCGLGILSFLPQRVLPRYLFLALGSTVLLRYLYWRLTSTLPPTADVVGFSFGCLLLTAELFCAFVLAISMLINAAPLRRPSLPRSEDADLPSVDIFIPSYNEDQTILAMTIAAAKGMDYPAEKLTVWLLDDGGTDQKCADRDPLKAEAARDRRALLQDLCRKLGAVYLTRARNEHAKAGNLNNGLAHSRGEIAVVFDADHAPFAGFLRETVGYFRLDPKLFLVQTPHVFLNPDPIERNLQTFEHMPSENEMFYGITQRGLDKWNGSFFCGSAALLRRAALMTTGGFSGITITEDCETALGLHAQGWTSIYVDKPLIAGLQPETFSSFIGQRSRWCQGMFQIFLLKNPALHKGLKPIQRIAYASSMVFWFFPIPRLIFMIAPLLYIFLDVKIFVSSLDETLAYTLSYMSVNMLMQSYLYGQVRWPWMSELYEYVQGVFLIKAIVSVVVSPHKPTFNVTSKGISLDNDHLSELAWPFVAVFVLLCIGVGTAAWRYLFEPGVTSLMLVVGIWTSFNLVLAGVSLGVVAERAQTERHPRLPIARQGFLEIDGHRLAVAIDHVSAGGCCVSCTSNTDAIKTTASQGFLSVVPHAGGAPLACIAVTRTGDGGRFTLDFGDIAIDQYRAVAELMYGDTAAIQRFLARRHKPIGLLRGSLKFIVWGVTEPFRAFVSAFHKKPVASAVATVAQGENGFVEQPVPVAPAQIDEASWLAAIVELSSSTRQGGFPSAQAERVSAIAGAA